MARRQKRSDRSAAKKSKKMIIQVVISDGDPPQLLSRREVVGKEGKGICETWTPGTAKIEFTYVAPEGIGDCLELIEAIHPDMKDSVEACRTVLSNSKVSKAELGRKHGRVNTESPDKGDRRAAHSMAGMRLMKPFKDKRGFPLVWNPPGHGRAKGGSKSQVAPASVSVYEAVKAIEAKAQAISDPSLKAKVLELTKWLESNLPK